MSQSVEERFYTAQEFARMPQFNERYELLDGKLVEKPMPKFEQSYISRLILKAYDRFDLDEQIGIMLAEISVRIREDYVPTPDLSFWIAERKPVRKIEIAPYPDLAIEIQSEGQSIKGLLQKAKEYQKAGVKLVWVIQTNKKIVTVFHQGHENPVTIQPTGELDGEDVISGFKLALTDLFE